MTKYHNNNITKYHSSKENFAKESLREIHSKKGKEYIVGCCSSKYSMNAVQRNFPSIIIIVTWLDGKMIYLTKLSFTRHIG